MAKESATGALGLLAGLRNLSNGTLELVQTRLGLLINEIQIQKHLWVQQLWTSLALLFCLTLAVLLLVALAVLLWWEQRLWVLGSFGLLFALLSLYFFVLLSRRREQEPPLLALSLAELQEDVRQLKEFQVHGPAAR